MPDQTVEVTYDPNADPPFTFVPDTVTMTAAGKVVLLRRPSDAPWLFKGGSVTKNEAEGLPSQFFVTVEGDGRLLHIHDACTDHTKTTYKYTVTVELNRNSRVSPDPVIVNDPGGGG